ncbi:hypothetical protein CRYUN_Cryun08bG0144300 [Craigia yunnanensis]
MAAENTSIHSLEHTPTWVLATVCFLFISVSIALEHSIHLLTNWLKRRRKHALTDAVEKLKSELMLLGFMSYLFSGTQSPISDICIPAKIADIMLPCRKKTVRSKITYDQHLESKSTYGNILSVNGLYDDILWDTHRRLADEQSVAASDPCSSQGKVSLMTIKGMRQQQQFIFVVAVMQIVYSVLTMALGRAKMRKWKAWEKESQTTEYQAAHGPERFRLTSQTTFARRHVSSCTETSVQLWINAFELAFFICVPIQFGLDSCYHEHTVVVITRIVLPITVQVLCSYITLPLYALVTQMGSQFKGPVLEDQIAKIMKQWHAGVRERRKKQELLQDYNHLALLCQQNGAREPVVQLNSLLSHDLALHRVKAINYPTEVKSLRNMTK